MFPSFDKSTTADDATFSSLGRFFWHFDFNDLDLFRWRRKDLSVEVIVDVDESLDKLFDAIKNLFLTRKSSLEILLRLRIIFLFTENWKRKISLIKFTFEIEHLIFPIIIRSEDSKLVGRFKFFLFKFSSSIPNL